MAKQTVLIEGGVEVKTPVAGEQRTEWKNYTGMTNITPLKFNPTKQDLIDIKGISAEKAQYLQEPVYTGYDNESQPYMDLTLLYSFSPKEYLEGEHPDKVFGNLKIRVSRKEIQSQSGKYKFINNKCQMTWATDVDAITQEWYDKTEVRKCKEGEDTLYSFIYALSDRASTKEAPMVIKIAKSYDDVMESIINGDVDLLNNLLTSEGFVYPDKSPRRVNVLMGITRSKDGTKKYQTIFTSKVHDTFAKEGRQLNKKVITDLVNNPITWKGDFQKVTDFRVYVEQEQPKTEIKEDTTVDTSEGTYEGLY